MIPALIDFQPDMIFLSCGLDGHRKDEMNHGFVSLQVRSFVCLVCLVLLVLLSLVSLLFFIFLIGLSVVLTFFLSFSTSYPLLSVAGN